MRASPADPPAGGFLDDLALRIFRYQYERNPPYGAYCRRRGRTPETVTRWEDIPAVPTAAFKELPIVAGDAGSAQAIFRTSGTTRGREGRGEHHVLDLSLYRASLLPTFRRFVLPDDARLPMLSLLPPPEQLPDSSLAFMVAEAIAAFGTEGSGHYASVRHGIEHSRLEAFLERAEAAGRPVLVLGTTFSFVHWLERLEASGKRFRLSPGSRIMDTGGYKGSGREVTTEEMWSAYEDRLGVPATYCVNEYGMTELCSQLYDTILRDEVTAAGAGDAPSGARRRKAGPPWMRTVVVDPEELEPLPPEEVGLLRHLDLANLDSVVAVQTEDVGRAVPGGIQLMGRVLQAPPRGCSIAMDDLLAGSRES